MFAGLLSKAAAWCYVVHTCHVGAYVVHTVWYLACGVVACLGSECGMFAGLLSKADAHFYLQIRQIWLVLLLFKLYLHKVPNHNFYVNDIRKSLYRVPHDFYNLCYTWAACGEAGSGAIYCIKGRPSQLYRTRWA